MGVCAHQSQSRGFLKSAQLMGGWPGSHQNTTTHCWESAPEPRDDKAEVAEVLVVRGIQQGGARMGQRWGHATSFWAYSLVPVSSPSSLTAAGTEDACPLQGLLTHLPDTPVGQPSVAPSPSSSSDPPGARGQGSPLPISEWDPARGLAPSSFSPGLRFLPCELGSGSPGHRPRARPLGTSEQAGCLAPRQALCAVCLCHWT